MPAVRAERLCPDAVFVPPDFTRYRTVSRLAREIFKRHTDLVEPLSLDEAYLDVTENKTGLPTATRVARAIREQIRLAEAGWTLRDSTNGGGSISVTAAGWTLAWSRQSDRREA